jgi:hypothetical protein
MGLSGWDTRCIGCSYTVVSDNRPMVKVFKKYTISIENISKLMFIEHDKCIPIILKKGKVRSGKV